MTALEARRGPARRPAARRLVTAAAVAYVANCLWGTAVAVRIIRTKKLRVVHHGLFVVTATLTGVAATTPSGPRPLGTLPAAGPGTPRTRSTHEPPLGSTLESRGRRRTVLPGGACSHGADHDHETRGTHVELFEAIRRRRTTNGAFLPDPVSEEEHQRLLMELAGTGTLAAEQPAVAVRLVEERDDRPRSPRSAVAR